MLLGNNSVLLKSAGRNMGGPSLSAERSNWNRTGAMRNWYFDQSDTMSEKIGQPNASLAPYAWMLPQVAGGLASINRLGGSGAANGAGTLGKNATASLTGGLAEALVGISTTGSLSTADLSGSSLISAASILGYWIDALGAATGTGSLTASISGAPGWIFSDLAGSGEISLAPYAQGWIEANITPFTDLSPENLSAAVWAAVSASHNDPETMGAKVNAALTLAKYLGLK